MAARATLGTIETRWRNAGLTDEQVEDLLGLVSLYVNQNGVTVYEAAEAIDAQVGAAMEQKLLARVRNVIAYGSDLDK